MLTGRNPPTELSQCSEDLGTVAMTAAQGRRLWDVASAQPEAAAVYLLVSPIFCINPSLFC